MNQRHQSLQLARCVVVQLREHFDEQDNAAAGSALDDLEFSTDETETVIAKRVHKFLSRIRPYYFLTHRPQLKQSVTSAIDALEKGFGL